MEAVVDFALLEANAGAGRPGAGHHRASGCATVLTHPISLWIHVGQQYALFCRVFCYAMFYDFFVYRLCFCALAHYSVLLV
jgi:hypothetical protein